MSLRKIQAEKGLLSEGEVSQEIALREELGETAIVRDELLARLHGILDSMN